MDEINMTIKEKFPDMDLSIRMRLGKEATKLYEQEYMEKPKQKKVEGEKWDDENIYPESILNRLTTPKPNKNIEAICELKLDGDTERNPHGICWLLRAAMYGSSYDTIRKMESITGIYSGKEFVKEQNYNGKITYEYYFQMTDLKNPNIKIDVLMKSGRTANLIMLSLMDMKVKVGDKVKLKISEKITFPDGKRFPQFQTWVNDEVNDPKMNFIKNIDINQTKIVDFLKNNQMK